MSNLEKGDSDFIGPQKDIDLAGQKQRSFNWRNELLTPYSKGLWL